MKGRELKELCCNLRDPLVKKREMFLKRLLPRHPPVLGEWFRRTFPDAQVGIPLLIATKTPSCTLADLANSPYSLHENCSCYVYGGLHSRLG